MAIRVSFNGTNPDLLLRNPDLLLKNVNFIIQTAYKDYISHVVDGVNDPITQVRQYLCFVTCRRLIDLLLYIHAGA